MRMVRAELAWSVEREAIAQYLDGHWGQQMPPPLSRLSLQQRTAATVFPGFHGQRLDCWWRVRQTARGLEVQEAALASKAQVPDRSATSWRGRRGAYLVAEQHTLEAASVPGLEFSAAAVAARVDHRDAAVERRCEQLAARQQFLKRLGSKPGLTGRWRPAMAFCMRSINTSGMKTRQPTQRNFFIATLAERQSTLRERHARSRRNWHAF